ncbi:MAG: SusC/RagA family TonB-linked outer membrane protein [Sediminibacterium sp.]|nr:SusC/RagA family TonB-linked outer membrane protein [Sediminibacterium sp.]
MRKLSMFFCTLLICFQVMAQNRTITGKVVGEGGPLVGATVQVTGFPARTLTNAAGDFTISAPPTAKSLTVSYVGFDSRTITLGKENSYAVNMKSSTSSLEDVVVSTGITKQKKSEFTGAGSTVTAKALVDKPVGSFDQLLQGQVPGLLAITGSGQPGQATSIIIRGQGSIIGGSNPLYVIDGIPVEAAVFQGLNPNDFESLDVLRDASAASLYGSRGSAGVIVVTTKKGVAGKAKLSYNVQYGQKAKPDFAFRPMTTAELLQAQEDYGRLAAPSGGTANIPGWFYSKTNPRYATLGTAGQATADRLLDSIRGINTNWADYMFRNGNFTNHQISLSGGTGRTRIYSSLEYYGEEGTTPRTDMKRVSLRTNIDYADDKFSYSFQSSLAYVKRNFQQSTTTNSTGNPFLAVNIQSPYARVFKPNGVDYATGVGASFTGANQLDLTRYDENYNDQLKAVLGLSVSYKITEDITAAATVGGDFRETQNSVYGSRVAFSRTPAATADIRTLAGFQQESSARYFQADIRPSVNYNKVFAQRHKLNVGVYGELIQQWQKGFNLTGYGIDPRTPNTPSAITQGDAVNQLFSAAGGSKTQNSTVGVLGIATYSFDSKYSLTGSYRYDGSSKLPTVNRWAPFYSVAANWNISKEKFLANSKVVDNLRLRASYGSSGNSDNFPFSDFYYLATYAASGNYSGITTQTPTSLGNPDLKWETVYQGNIGLDFSMFRNRLYGSVDVYDKRTKNLFVLKTLSAEGSAIGLTSQQINAGTLQNKGVEVDLGYDIIKGRDFIWSVNTKFAYNKNTILDLGGVPDYASGTGKISAGKPLGAHYEVKWAGVDPTNGSALYYDLNGKLTTTYSTSNAVQDYGTWESPWKGGFGSSVHYKAFDLSILFSWQTGGFKYDNLEYFVENPIGFLAGGYNQSSDLNFWKKAGDIATTPNPAIAGTNFSSKLIHPSDFLRLRDLTLSYTMPASVTSGTKFISKMRFYVQGTNLAIWTKWRGMDPEAGPTNINLSEFPNPRAVTVGLNVTF